jgi:hypothetical protein
MEILAGLVNLNPNSNILPVPWYNRPALGLISNTEVHIGVVKASAGEPTSPPDIIVTPLVTARLRSMVSVTIDLSEKPGALFEALSLIRERFNIALAESVTVDQRTKHRITLVLEPSPPYLDDDKGKKATIGREEFQADLKSFEAEIRGNEAFRGFVPHKIIPDDVEFEKEETGTVRNGELVCGSIFDWIHRRYKPGFEDKFDFSRIVVSSNDESRFIRYIYPRKGVFEVPISHTNYVGALKYITGIIGGLKYNILLSRLSRSGGAQATANKNVFVAICEPLEPPAMETHIADTEKRIKEALDDSKGYQAALQGLSSGRSIEEMAHPKKRRHRDIREIYAPDDIAPHFHRTYGAVGNRAIFASYRKAFARWSCGQQLSDAIFKKLDLSGYTIWDGFNRPGPISYSPADTEVRARAWYAAAGLFFFYGEQEAARTEAARTTVHALSDNQHIELGINYSLNRPFIGIVDKAKIAEAEKFMIAKASLVTYGSLEDADELDRVANEVATRMLDAIAYYSRQR